MTNILTSYHFCGLVHEALILLECFLILSSDHRCIFQCFLKFFGCGVWAIGQVLCPDRSLRHTWDEIRRIEIVFDTWLFIGDRGHLRPWWTQCRCGVTLHIKLGNTGRLGWAGLYRFVWQLSLVIYTRDP